MFINMHFYAKIKNIAKIKGNFRNSLLKSIFIVHSNKSKIYQKNISNFIFFKLLSKANWANS
jgi:hypothetical protein